MPCVARVVCVCVLSAVACGVWRVACCSWKDALVDMATIDSAAFSECLHDCSLCPDYVTLCEVQYLFQQTAGFELIAHMQPEVTHRVSCSCSCSCGGWWWLVVSGWWSVVGE